MRWFDPAPPVHMSKCPWVRPAPCWELAAISVCVCVTERCGYIITLHLFDHWPHRWRSRWCARPDRGGGSGGGLSASEPRGSCRPPRRPRGRRPPPAGRSYTEGWSRTCLQGGSNSQSIMGYVVFRIKKVVACRSGAAQKQKHFFYFTFFSFVGAAHYCTSLLIWLSLWCLYLLM